MKCGSKDVDFPPPVFFALALDVYIWNKIYDKYIDTIEIN